LYVEQPKNGEKWRDSKMQRKREINRKINRERNKTNGKRNINKKK
jgi:hypothetical protein